MKILAVGDVTGSIGCNYLAEKLSVIKKEYGINLCIVNGENSADGNGITPFSATALYNAGADVITGGNHSLRRHDILERFETDPFLLCPHNIKTSASVKGYSVIDLGFTSVAIINLVGSVYMPECANPFNTADLLIDKAKNDGVKTIIVDFHAEATSEKKVLAFYLDGKVSAVFGTHTHVQTADEQVSKNGTGYITDIGMTGPIDSVLGVKNELSLAKIKDNAPVKFSLADGKCRLDGCIFEIDHTTGKCISVKRISI